jgi:hypothetical protein
VENREYMKENRQEMRIHSAIRSLKNAPSKLVRSQVDSRGGHDVKAKSSGASFAKLTYVSDVTFGNFL